jgi:hypothetical protein
LRQAWHQRNIETTEEGTLEAGADAPRETPLRIAEAKELGAQIQRSLDAIPNDYRLLLLRGKLYRARKAFAAAFKQTA